jgi:general secretion pathway protein E
LVLDDAMRSMIHDRDSEQKMREYADAKGMQRLREDAMRWVLAGETALEEVIRATRD